MKKSVFSVLSAAGVLLLVAACTASKPSDTTGQQSSAASSTVIMEPGADGQEDGQKDDNVMQEPGADGQEDGGAALSAGTAVSVGVNVGMSARVIPITANNFTFSPAAISVKKGEKITLRLTGKEGNHGFAVADLGINTPVSEGKTVDVDLPTDKAGTFSFRCSVPCGSGHRDMTGTITITE